MIQCSIHNVNWQVRLALGCTWDKRVSAMWRNNGLLDTQITQPQTYKPLTTVSV